MKHTSKGLEHDAWTVATVITLLAALAAFSVLIGLQTDFTPSGVDFIHRPSPDPVG
jgi:hypothetical protein